MRLRGGFRKLAVGEPLQEEIETDEAGVFLRECGERLRIAAREPGRPMRPSLALSDFHDGLEAGELFEARSAPFYESFEFAAKGVPRRCRAKVVEIREMRFEHGALERPDALIVHLRQSG